MKVILLDDVENVGKSGQLITVKDGFARNYLLPRKLAAMATSRSIKEIEHQKRVAEKRTEKRQKTSADLRTKIEALAVTITRPVGEGDKLYGSVTPRDIETAMREEGVVVDKKKIRIDEPIRALGVYTVHVHLDGGDVPLKLWVVANK